MNDRRSFGHSLRRYLLQGLAVIGPLGITAVILWWLFVRVDGLLGQWLGPLLGRSAPGLGLAILVIILLVVGWVVEKTIGNRLLAIGESLLSRVPLVRRLYAGSSRIVKAVIGEEKIAFREVVLFEYPMKGRWSYGFVTGSAPSSAHGVLDDEGVTVYMPTAPNPMSGFLMVTDRSAVVPVDITVEEAFTYILSAGAVSPGRAAELLDTGEIRITAASEGPGGAGPNDGKAASRPPGPE